MKKLLLLILFIFSLNINAQHRHKPTKAKEKCISTKIIETKESVSITKINKCTQTKTTKVYTVEEWKKMLEERKTRRKEMVKKYKGKRTKQL